MGLSDMAGSAKDKLGSDKGEQLSDQGLDKASQAASERVGDQNADKVDQAREQADKRVGNE